MSRHQRYDASRLNARQITDYAARVATALLERGEIPRRPRPPTTSTEIVSYGLFGLRRETVTHRDKGGKPRFWIVGVRRERGVFIVDNPGVGTKPHGWMSGDAIVLRKDGSLNFAEWREAPLGSYWTVTDFREISDTGLTMLDYADRARWRQVRPLRGEQHREELTDHYVLSVRAPGMGLSLGLKRLLGDDGARIDGHLTGLYQRPAGP
jgi:hypothetical protein